MLRVLRIRFLIFFVGTMLLSACGNIDRITVHTDGPFHPALIGKMTVGKIGKAKEGSDALVPDQSSWDDQLVFGAGLKNSLEANGLLAKDSGKARFVVNILILRSEENSKETGWVSSDTSRYTIIDKTTNALVYNQVIAVSQPWISGFGYFRSPEYWEAKGKQVAAEKRQSFTLFLNDLGPDSTKLSLGSS